VGKKGWCGENEIKNMWILMEKVGQIRYERVL